MNWIDTFTLAEKHLTYDLEDTWTCTTPQLQRLIAEAQAQALRDAAEKLYGSDAAKGMLESMADDLERKA